MADLIWQADPTRSKRANRRRAYMIAAHHPDMAPRPTNKTERRLARPSAYVLPEPWQPARSKRRRRDAERPSPVTSTPANLPLTWCQQCMPDGALTSYCEPRLHDVGRRQLLVTRADPEPKTLQVKRTQTGKPVPTKEKRKRAYWTL